MRVGTVLNKLAETAEHVREFTREFAEAAAATFRRTMNLISGPGGALPAAPRDHPHQSGPVTIRGARRAPYRDRPLGWLSYVTAESCRPWRLTPAEAGEASRPREQSYARKQSYVL
jgi:hypothetical protein